MSKTVISISNNSVTDLSGIKFTWLWNDNSVINNYEQIDLGNSQFTYTVTANVNNTARGMYLIFQGDELNYNLENPTITALYRKNYSYDSNITPDVSVLTEEYVINLHKDTYNNEVCYKSDFIKSYNAAGEPPLGFSLYIYTSNESVKNSILKLKSLTNKVSLTINTSNCSVSPETVNSSGTTAITVTADDGYSFNTAPTIAYSDPFGESITNSFNLSSDNKTATLSFNADNADTSSTITVTANALKDTATTTFYFDVSSVTNASATPLLFTIGETVNITITAYNGYNFDSTLPYIEYYDLSYARTQNNFTLNDDKTIATYIFDSSIAITSDSVTYPIKLVALANVTTQLANLYTVYIVTDKDLSTIAQHRFGDSGISNYINDVYLLPLNLDTSNRQSMYLYNTKLLDDVGVVKDRIIKYVLGSFTLPRKYNNANDYNNSYYIALPYYGIHELDKTKFMDSPIEIVMIVDVIQGTANYQFKRDNQVIESLQTTIKIGLPYLTANESRISGFTNVERLEVTPTIKSYAHSIPVTNTSNDYNTQLSNISGYCECTMLYIEVNEHYKEMINSALSKGVYINGL